MTTTTTERLCANCHGPMPARKAGRGRPPRYCGDTCKAAVKAAQDANRGKARQEREKAAETAAHAARVREFTDALGEAVEAVYTAHGVPTPGAAEWTPVMEALPSRLTRLYRRVWRKAAERDERHREERGLPAPMTLDRLLNAVVALLNEADADPTFGDGQMKSPEVARVDPRFIGVDSEEQPFAAIPFAHLIDKFDGDKMEAQTGIGRIESPYWNTDHPAMYEADPALREGPKVSDGRWNPVADKHVNVYVRVIAADDAATERHRVEAERHTIRCLTFDMRNAMRVRLVDEKARRRLARR